MSWPKVATALVLSVYGQKVPRSGAQRVQWFHQRFHTALGTEQAWEVPVTCMADEVRNLVAAMRRVLPSELHRDMWSGLVCSTHLRIWTLTSISPEAHWYKDGSTVPEWAGFFDRLNLDIGLPALLLTTDGAYTEDWSQAYPQLYD